MRRCHGNRQAEYVLSVHEPVLDILNTILGRSLSELEERRGAAVAVVGGYSGVAVVG